MTDFCNLFMKRLFPHRQLLILLLLIVSNCNSNKNSEIVNETITEINYSDGYGFSFNLPEDIENITNDELGKNLRKINPTLNFIAIVGLPFGNSLFSVSAFEIKEETPIDSAFMNTVKYDGNISSEKVVNYRLINYGIDNINNRDFRYKISCLDGSIYNIMYYFMKDDCSNILYEIKLVCQSEDKLKSAQDFLENVALTVEFRSED